MKSRVLTIVVLVTFGCCVVLAQATEKFVGRTGADYTVCTAILPIQNVPLGLDTLLAKALFRSSNIGVETAFRKYKNQYDDILKANEDNQRKAGKRKHFFKITWIGYEEGCYASCITEAKLTDSKGNYIRKHKWSFLYDLKHNKLLHLKDVFTLPVLSEIDNIKGSKYHQMLIKQKDSLILQFMQDQQIKEAVFPIRGNTKVFNHYFLNLLESKSDITSLSESQTPHPCSDVDTDIPTVSGENSNTFAVIIANENYQEEVKVDYALNDGETFKQYCQKVLGLPEKNIHIRKDATLNNLKAELSWLQQVAEAYNGDARFIVFYAGHGIPDEKSGNSYLLSVDGKGTMLDTGYSLQQFYKQLGEMPSAGVTVFMDACFSGSKRGDGMLASTRGVAIKAKPQAPQGKMVVFSAAQSDETAYPYKEKGHGLFTYYILKKLKETRGNVSLEDLARYVTIQVKRESIVSNGKSQTPTVSASASVGDTWKNLRLK